MLEQLNTKQLIALMCARAVSSLMAAYDGNVRRVLANWENDPLILKTRTYYIRLLRSKINP